MPGSSGCDNQVEKKPEVSQYADYLISVIVPCFNEAEVIHLLYVALKAVLRSLKDAEHEIIFVDDGSKDDTLVELNRIAEKDPCVRVCSLSRNFGHEIAMAAGLDAAEGDAAIIMDADLQHPPELIPEMINKWKDGYDIVSPVRQSTTGISWFKKVSAAGFYSILNLLTDTRIPPGASDFNLFSRRAYMAMRSMPERHRFQRCISSWIGFERGFVPYAAPERAAGESKYTVLKLIALALDGIFSFSTTPLRIATRLGVVLTFFGLAYLIWILARYVLYGVTTAGWASLICVTLILGGFNLISVGMLGQYLSRVFEEVKGRPMYILKQEPSPRKDPQAVKKPAKAHVSAVQTPGVQAR